MDGKCRHCGREAGKKGVRERKAVKVAWMAHSPALLLVKLLSAILKMAFVRVALKPPMLMSMAPPSPMAAVLFLATTWLRVQVTLMVDVAPWPPALTYKPPPPTAPRGRETPGRAQGICSFGRTTLRMVDSRHIRCTKLRPLPLHWGVNHGSHTRGHVVSKRHPRQAEVAVDDLRPVEVETQGQVDAASICGHGAWAQPLWKPDKSLVPERLQPQLPSAEFLQTKEATTTHLLLCFQSRRRLAG
jgi:hypothetical protein